MRKTIEEGLNFEPTSNTTPKDGDLFVDSVDNSLKFQKSGEIKPVATLQPNDILETEFNFSDNQSVAAPVTELTFSNDVKYFKASVYISRGLDGESVELIGVNASGGWVISSVNPTGDDTGVDFSINAGQVEYTSTSTGAGGVIVYKAQTIEYTV